MANLSIQLGLVTVPVKSDVAIMKERTEMKNLCVGQPEKTAHAPTPLTAPKTCTSCGPIVDYGALKKGIQQGDTFAIVEQDDVAEAKEAYSKEYKKRLNLVPHPAQQFLGETAPGDTVHYLVPADASAEGHYQLIRQLVESHPELAFASLHTPRSATSLYMLRVREGVLVMEKRVRSQALKPVPSVGGEVNELLFAQLDSMLPMFVADYDAEAYEDKYEKALAEMVASAEQVTVTSETRATAPVATTDEDLLAKLTALAGTATKAKKKPAPKKKAAAKAA